jgi:hypothetical protein
MKSGTIKHIDPDGQWNGMKKSKVTFKDGRAYTFFSKGEFVGSIGDTIKYTVTNEDMYNAKLIREDLKNKKVVSEIIEGEKYEDVKTHEYYLDLRSSCIKAAAEFNSQRVSDIESLIKDAEQMYNWINE